MLAVCGCCCCRPHIKLSLSQECRLPVKYLITHCGAATDAQRALADKTTTAAGAAIRPKRAEIERTQYVYAMCCCRCCCCCCACSLGNLQVLASVECVSVCMCAPEYVSYTQVTLVCMFLKCRVVTLPMCVCACVWLCVCVCVSRCLFICPADLRTNLALSVLQPNS